MADRFYGVDRGGQGKDVSEDSSTTSKDVEIRIDLSAGMERHEVLLLIDELKGKVLEDTWPPA